MLNESISNGSGNSSLWYEFDIGTTLKISLTAAYTITFVTALLGNILLLYIIRLHRPFNSVFVLIANMAASDLLAALFAMPYSIAYLYVQQRWFGGIFGTISCKFVNFVVGTTIAVSIFALLTISVERYIAVVKPLAYPTFIKRPILLSIGIWLASVLFMSVYFYNHDVEVEPDGTALCFINWDEVSPKIFYSTVAIVLYVLPLFIIAVLSVLIIRKLKKTTAALKGEHPAEQASHTTRKRNFLVMRMLLVIVALFAVCWLPVHVLHLLIHFFVDVYFSLPPSVALCLFWVSHANSALNPCVFILLNPSFRKSFMGIIRSLCQRNHRVRHINKRNNVPPAALDYRPHGCLPQSKSSRKYSVRWNKHEPTTPITILDIRHEGNSAL